MPYYTILCDAMRFDAMRCDAMRYRYRNRICRTYVTMEMYNTVILFVFVLLYIQQKKNNNVNTIHCTQIHQYRMMASLSLSHTHTHTLSLYTVYIYIYIYIHTYIQWLLNQSINQRSKSNE
jgi:hypothetical protein